MEKNKIWFKRKRYGWGWTPVSWQGWLIIAVYLLIIIRIVIVSNVSNPTSGSDKLFAFAVPFIVVNSILIFICYIKGESPKWQWGEEKK